MGLIKGERKEQLFLGEQEFKSKAEKKRVLKATEEEKIVEVNEFIDGLVKTYGDFLEIGEYIKLGKVKLIKKEKDGVTFVDVKVKL